MFTDEDNKIELKELISCSLPTYTFTNGINEIEDPWYSDRYELVFSQLKQCIIDIFKNIK